MRIKASHVVYWICIYLIWAYLKSYGGVTLTILISIIPYLIVFIMIYYTLRKWQIPRLFNEGKHLLFVLSVIVSSLVGLGILVALFKGMHYLHNPSVDFLPNSSGGYVLEMIQFYSPAVPLLSWESYIDRRKEQDEIKILEKENLANELKYVKTKINPNFLIESLKKIQLEVDQNTTNAPNLILMLSGVLDYILYKGQNNTVNLKEELTILEQFLKLNETRYGSLQLSGFDEDYYSRILIKPLTFLTIVQALFSTLKPKEGTLVNGDLTLIKTNELIELNISLDNISTSSYQKLDTDALRAQTAENSDYLFDIKKTGTIVFSRIRILSYE